LTVTYRPCQKNGKYSLLNRRKNMMTSATPTKRDTPKTWLSTSRSRKPKRPKNLRLRRPKSLNRSLKKKIRRPRNQSQNQKMPSLPVSLLTKLKVRKRKVRLMPKEKMPKMPRALRKLPHQKVRTQRPLPRRHQPRDHHLRRDRRLLKSLLLKSKSRSQKYSLLRKSTVQKKHHWLLKVGNNWLHKATRFMKHLSSPPSDQPKWPLNKI
jgi:hypothetical protein